MIELRYFAWVRERIGVASETYEGDAATIDELLDDLEARGEGYAAALSDRALIRVAVDEEIASENAAIVGAQEVAIFPPMTGG